MPGVDGVLVGARACSSWPAVFLAVWLAVGCQPDRERVGSETNWLAACASDAECQVGLCQCGVCASPCEGDATACGEQGGICIAFTGASGEACRLGFDEPQAGGLCSHGCQGPADCPGDGVRCLQGVCLPAAAETPRGTIAMLAGRDEARASGDGDQVLGSGDGDQAPSTGDGDQAPSTGDGDQAPSIGDGDQAPSTGDGDQAPSTGDGPATAGADAGVPQLDAADPGLGGTTTTLGGLTSSNPTPKPQCPCESELASEAEVPRPGDAAANRYGRPIAGADPQDTLFGGTTAMECETQHLPGFWFIAGDDSCVRYTSCDLACEGDADCPDGGSGSASPRCARTGACYLDCGTAGSRCPDGMACVQGQDGAACYWPFSVLSPECGAYCAQPRIPRECPNWCAGLLVACAPDAGVACCAGLVCTEEGYCDAP